MPTLTFLIKNYQPILATALQGDPNTDVSYGYLPGSTIRGALISRYMQQNGDFDPENPNVKRLFFDGSTCYLNAYLCDSENQRTLPVPRCFFRRKSGDEKYIYNFSCEEPTEFQKKAIDGFCIIDGSIYLHKERRRLNIHNKRDRRYGRGRDGGDGEIFRYDALDANQCFKAIITCQSDADIQSIRQLLERDTTFFLGGSQTAGYGHAEVLQIEEVDWIEIATPLDYRLQRSPEQIVITLTSDLLLRNRFGQFAAEHPTEALESCLGQNLKLVESYLKTTYIGGFNRKWGLQLPQVQAIAAGSVFVYQCNNISPQALAALERDGLGERRAEGFGRLVISWFENAPEFYAPEVDKRTLSEPISLKPDSPDAKLAQDIASRILRQRLEQELIKTLHSQISQISNGMGNRQWSRLMRAALAALISGDEKSINDLLGSLRSNARTQFDKTKIDGEKLPEKIKSWLGNSNTLWTRVAPVVIADKSCSVTPELEKEYTFRLITALAKSMMKLEEAA
jgi:CRISPR-associated protein Csx10